MPAQEYLLAKLHFHSPLHLSRGRDAYDETAEVLHSDTLKSALFVCAKQLYGDAIDRTFLDSFTLSSAFPFLGNELFFPKPSWRLPISFDGKSEEDKGVAKMYKKLAYLSKSYFEATLAGTETTVAESQLIDKRFLSEQANPSATLWKREVQQRVTVPHMGEVAANEKAAQPRPFYMERIFFADGAGLFCLVKLNDADKTTQERLTAALKLLGDNGIGTDKTVGNGQFSFEKLAPISLNVPENAPAQIALSLYCPEREELTEDMLNESAYNLVKRGGYVASPENIEHITLRKRAVYMFTEGSVFATQNALVGKCADLKPEGVGISHAIWRDGRALFLPFVPTPPSTPNKA